jgi:hypothetical protein
VRPIDGTFLRLWTTMTIVLGCTGMIVLTGALVQVFTLFQFRRLLGLDRMHRNRTSERAHHHLAMAASACNWPGSGRGRPPFWCWNARLPRPKKRAAMAS